MTKAAWDVFCTAKSRYKRLVEEISAVPDLGAAVQKLVDHRAGPSYTVDTPAVYNLALDELTPDSEIKMILVADNPGRREQAAENRRYLVGPSGKIAEGFFRSSPALGIDFRANVLILNKTPVHTPRTAELKELCRIGGESLKDAVLSSQRVMAELLAEFWEALRKDAGRRWGGRKNSPEFEAAGELYSGPKEEFPAGFLSIPIWIIGYSEMKKGGIFETYTERLKELCGDNPTFKEHIFFYRHFSMNQFAIDLKRQTRPGGTVEENLRRIGAAYRERVLDG
ncbi:MAG: hypothetical protein LBD31_02845 [Treponema sp.]|jgi:hypothetical protein|nr:hypothetical protein [Treponema sp.]